MKGHFITLEGVEGSGKSTQMTLLATALLKQGKNLIVTREPGGTLIGDQIRRILLDPESKNLAPTAELLLYAAARCQHVQEVILPALEKGNVILCDRYFDATTAYQGFARGLSRDILASLHKIATNDLKPDTTLLFDCPAEIGLQRARGRQAAQPVLAKEGRFENEALAFHKKVREGYLQLAKVESNRFHIFDGTKEKETLHREVLEYVQSRLRT